MLPNESLLIVLQFADYRTLVLAKLAGAPLLRLATKYAEDLARHRSFRITFRTAYISYIDLAIGERAKRIRYEPGNQQSLVAACRELDAVTGPHTVANLIIFESTMNMPDVGAVFEAATALKYAGDVDLYWPDGSTGGSTNPEVFLHNFEGMKTLRLSLDYSTFRQLSWAFLRKESTRGLRLIKVSGCRSPPTGSMDRSAEELVRYCVTLPHLQDGEPLELDFSDNHFSGAFGLRIVELLRSTAREATFRMRADYDDAELIRNAVGAQSHYSIDYAGNYITHYASDNSGIEVKAKGSLRGGFRGDESQYPCAVVIERTAEIPRKKPRNE
ncbi:hypothetical protein AAVH_24641 [Aphelenchoides avenae]|nr:hypothetical protein AAVH_24641 [Aphelenchus avenae]